MIMPPKEVLGDDLLLFKKPQRPVSEDGPKKPEAEIYCDGASSGNPGHAGIGVIIHIRDELHKNYNISEYIGVTTNNVAEYSALIKGIKEAQSLGLKRVEIFLDSELLVKQIKGIYRMKSASLRPFWEEAKNILRQFDSYRLTRVQRELNKEADLLAKRAIKNFKKLI